MRVVANEVSSSSADVLLAVEYDSPVDLERVRAEAVTPVAVSSNETRATLELALRLDEWLSAYDVDVEV